MNNTKIEWCNSTWNPITGCLHGCEYCYARNQVKRFAGHWNGVKHVLAPFGAGKCLAAHDHLKYKTKKGKYIRAPFPFGFTPTFHHYRLNEPAGIKKPKTIFVGSMCDMFGNWVPDEYIEKVFNACENAPHHRYLFLTKNPERYADYFSNYEDMPCFNWFMGASTATVNAVWEAGEALLRVEGNTFLSLEPLHEDLAKVVRWDVVDWVIVGAETGNRRGKITPDRGWIENIVEAAKEYDTPVFMKDSLAKIWGDPLMREFPW